MLLLYIILTQTVCTGYIKKMPLFFYLIQIHQHKYIFISLNTLHMYTSFVPFKRAANCLKIFKLQRNVDFLAIILIHYIIWLSETFCFKFKLTLIITSNLLHTSTCIFSESYTTHVIFIYFKQNYVSFSNIIFIAEK